MEELAIIIEELLYEKERLEKEKAENLEKIKACEDKIAYFTSLRTRNEALSIVFENQIDSYQKLDDYHSGTIFSLFEDPFDSYIDRRIDELSSKRKAVIREKKRVSICISYYESRSDSLELRNGEIDGSLASIEVKLDEAYLEKASYEGKTLERGNRNDRH